MPQTDQEAEKSLETIFVEDGVHPIMINIYRILRKQGMSIEEAYLETMQKYLKSREARQ